MTLQQQPTHQQQKHSHPVTVNSVSLDTPRDILDSQITIDPTARGDTYIPIQETNLPNISLSDIEAGVLLYDPRDSSAILEVLEQYQDDFGQEKVRVKVHSSDHRNERVHSLFAPHVVRDYTYVRVDDVEPDTEVEFSVDALTNSWDGDTADEKDSSVQTTLAKQETDGETAVTRCTDSKSKTTETTTQQTLF